MSNQMTPSRRHANREILHPADTREFVMKHRTAAFAATASIVTVTVVGIATAQAMTNNDAKETAPKVTTHETRAEGKSVTTSTTTSNNPESGTGPKTSVIVNDQPIAVPENGSVSRTVTNDNGTTQVEVSNSSNGSSVSSSVITNNSSTSSNTYSQSLNVTTNNSP